MFCNRCGTEMQPGLTACPNCGRQIGDSVSAVAQARLERHLHMVAILWMAIGALFMIPAIGLLIFGRGAHLVLDHQEPWPAIFPLFLFLASCTLVILAAGGICVGLGLIEGRPWARTAAIILAVLALFHPPFGTALGVYTLWVLLADEHGDEYRYLTRPTPQRERSPAP